MSTLSVRTSKLVHFFTVAAWWLVLLLQVAVLVVGTPSWLNNLRQVCFETVRICGQSARVTPADLELLRNLGWTLDGYALFNVVLVSLHYVLGIGIGILLFWRRGNDRIAWVASIFLIVGLETDITDHLAAVMPAWWLPTRILIATGEIAFALFLCLFPNGRFVPAWSRWLALVWGLVFVADNFFPNTVLAISSYNLLSAILLGGLLVLLLGVQFYRYSRVSDASERVQTKWVVSAIVLGILLFLISIIGVVRANVAGATLTPLFPWPAIGFSAIGILLPVAIGIAILRYRLFDIDVIIRRTLTYAIVAALLVVIYFGSVIVLQQVFAALTGQRSEVITVLSTLAIAALFVPVRNRVQRMMDRRFNRQKYNAQQVLADFGNAVRDETDLDKLTGRLIEVVNETMQPKSTSLWLKQEKGKTK